MAIELPARSGGGGRRRSARLPDSGDVRIVAPARDPGVAIPQGAFDTGAGGLADAAQAIETVGNRLAQAEQRIRTREDAVSRARFIGQFNEEATAELRRLETEGDFSTQSTIQEFGSFLNQRRTELLQNYEGSEESRAALDVRVEGLRSSFATRAGEMAATAQRKLVTDHLGNQINGLTAQVIQDPSSMVDMIESYDSIIADMAPALRPDEEEAYRSAGRQEITISALNGLMSRGDINGARELHDAPGVREMLTPAQQRQFDKTFVDYEQKRNEARLSAQRKVEEAEYIKGGGKKRIPLTLTERLKIATLEPDNNSPEAKISALERVLGPLSREQKERVLGVKAPDARTDAGKLVQDREMFASQYGEGSPQVVAFDEAAKDDGAPSMSDVGGIRKEFTNLSKSFVQVRDSFKRIAEAGREPSAAGDMALIFNFMKMLDPGSTVREGEFANAQNATGVPQRITNTYNRLMSGERLAEPQRADFLTQSQNLMIVQMQSQKNLENHFRGIAERAKANPDDVIVDFLGELRRGIENRDDSNGDTVPQSFNGGSKVIQLDMNGKVVGGDGR